MHCVNAHGARIPALGFGTFQLDEATCRELVGAALDTGYRHVDTAQMYRNEAAVGSAVQESGVARDDVFITTKVWPDFYRSKDFSESVARSLERLQLDRVDLLLLHWPSPEVPLEETLEALNQAREEGRTRHIGVSNFNTALLRRAVENSSAPLVTNQVEYHPYLRQQTLLEELARLDMSLTAYAPLAQGQVPRDPVLEEIGAPHGKSAAQVGLRWLLQQTGVAAIPRTSSAGHVASNFAVWDFELSDEEMARIHHLARPDGRLISPAGLAPEWD